ncbi:Transcription-repair-coupling factor [bacterium HR34]|nr:Transcription-repair-coupling factor [bacterium HR34]
MANKYEEIVVVSLTPYFLEREAVWFWQNIEKIKENSQKEGFFKENVLVLKKGVSYKLSLLKELLFNFNYELVENITFPGQFSIKGGILQIFPINYESPFIVEFLGDRIGSTYKNEDISIDVEKAKNTIKKLLTNQQIKQELSSLKEGDFLVHIDHGIGVFRGITKMQDINYFVLEYAKGDKLYVPENLKNKLTLYIGFENPRITRLGGSLWLKIKKKAREQAEQIAKKLIKIYASKESITRPKYNSKQADVLQREFDESFEYELTPDQEKAIKDIFNDLENSETPMDRLLCGDVGFGKTEIIMRTAFKVVCHGKQVAILCPTTVLAWQHYKNFCKRFEKFAVNIGLLTRNTNPKDEEKIIKDIKSGKIDIIIGTHKILSNKVEFKNLGMLVVDDEQKFGVLQKERLREKFPALDLLYVSATPIPRTLYLALSNIKKVSFIYTPPPERKDIITHIGEFKKEVMKKAILNELKRGGQVYVLENRIKNLPEIKKFVEEKLGIKERIEVIHSAMPDEKIIEIFNEFQEGKIKILVSTTIIENGIDISNANTLIIRDISRLGLGQAYQLRGRVGRGERQAFAYLFYPKWEKLTEKAKMRIKALKENLALGSGYRIALKDMEIRGAGNILGKEQSGPINKVGLNLYCHMISEASSYLQNENMK